MSRCPIFLLSALFCIGANADGRIDRIEPASWWAGMQDGRLQLLVHGERIAELQPSIAYPGVTMQGVKRADNPNYLFIDLALAPDVRPGAFRIDFRRRGTPVASHEYRLEAREPASAARKGFSPADAIYLITPDRFANGDPSNDRLPDSRDPPDRRNPAARHGGDLKGIVDRLDYVADMGFTQLWLSPVLENNSPQGSYHGYAITDFYRVDPRFGDNASYRSLAREARKRGLGLIMDVVLNHCGLQHWWMRDLPASNWINNGGRFSGTNHSRESLLDPHAAESDRRGFTDGWFVPSMPDLNQRNPEVATYLIQNTIWWIEYAGLSGLRVDTWSYSDRAFLAEWSARVMREYPALNIVGEEWSLDPPIVAAWQRGPARPGGFDSSLPSLFDFPLQSAVMQGLVENEAWNAGLHRIYRTLASDFVYPDPDSLVIFPDNHDMSRMFTQLGGQPDLYRMATALFLTTRGIPQLYYGSEILMANPGTDAHGVIRGDFPGGWPEDTVDGFSGRELTSPQRDAQAYTRTLLNWRKHSTAVHRGKLTQYSPVDGVYVYFRHAGRLKVMVVINKSADERRIDTARFQETIGTNTHATDVVSGQRHVLDQGIRVAGRSATILELHGDGPIPGGVTGRVVRHDNFPSRHVDARNIDVWLPPGYDGDQSRRFPVVYMHDGQNLFDPALSYIGVDWGIDETMTRLIREGAIRAAIVVGIWNTPKRTVEYVPQKAVIAASDDSSLPDVQELKRLQLESDDYLRFLVEELKPFIDSSYRTLPDRADTLIMGSSAGALISLYALTEYPQVFGGAGCLSTHWPVGDGIVINYLKRHLPAPPGHLFYFDLGTATLDRGYEPYQRRVDALMSRAGYREGVDWMTIKADGAEHSELAWRARVDVPLKFLLGR
jgi:glycosidase/predicted alpha/beta superfamily hydrolase